MARSVAHQRALEAAAKVAIAIGVSACSDPHDASDAAVTDATTKDAPPTSCPVDAWSGVGFDASADVFVGPPADLTIDDPTFQCCEALALSHVTIDAGIANIADAGDPMFRTCCRVVELGNATLTDPDPARQLVDLLACCDVTSDPISTCSLWGPPPAPEMNPRRRTARSGRIDLRRDARRIARSLRVPCTDDVLAAARATWRDRMIHEHVSSAVFSALAQQLQNARFSEAEIAECRAFAREERKHGVMCGAVVEALGGDAIADARVPPPLASHSDVSARVAVIRNLIDVSCMSETIAVALIGAERERMASSPLRALLTSIWADEIGHARFGWRIVARELPRMTRDERDQVARYLPLAFRHVRAHEIAHLRPIDVHADDVGVCDGREALALFEDVTREVIVPRLEAFGLPARRAHSESRAVI